MNLIHKKRFIKRDSSTSGRRIATAKTIGKDKGMLEKYLLRHPANAIKAARQCRVDDQYERRLNMPSLETCNNPIE